MNRYYVWLALSALLLCDVRYPASVNASDYFVNCVPVYELDVPADLDTSRFTYTADWLATTSPEEMNGAIAIGWNYRGIAFYIAPAQIPGTIPLARFYSA